MGSFRKWEVEWGKAWVFLNNTISLPCYTTTVHTLTLAGHTENVHCEFHKKRAGNGHIERVHSTNVNTIHRQGYLTSLLLANTELGLPLKRINKEKIWGIVIEKKKFKCLIHRKYCVYKENARTSTNKLLRTKKMSMVVGWKINTRNQ